MNKKGPILIIDDDRDDRDILAEVLKKINLPNRILYFSNGEEAYNYLDRTDEVSFIILSDINMPKMNGLELRAAIQRNERLRLKSIPFVFFTTATTKKAVHDAYELSVQGMFIKPNSFRDLEVMLTRIFDYWKDCKSPSDFP